MPTGGTAALPTYENLARSMGVDLGGWSFGAQFGDLNNDGFLDLYLVNGYVSASRAESYWYDYSKVAGGHEVVISDAKNWPAMGTRSLAGFQQKKVWINDGAGRFIDVAQMVGATDRYDGRSVALGDFSGQGTLDVVVANQRGPLLFYRNDVAPGRKWIAFALEGGCAAGVDGRHLHQSQRHRRAGRGVLERAAADPGSVGRFGLLLAEPASPALRSGRRGHGRQGRRAVAIR